MIIRSFNEKGISRMGRFLDSLTTSEPENPPEDLLTDNEFSKKLETDVEIEDQTFKDREEVGEFLNRVLDNANIEGVERDQGLWAWLSFFFFHQLCAKDRNGKYSPGARARWIPAFSDYRKYYRHLLYGPYRIYRAYRDDPTLVRGLLCNPPSSPGEFTEQMASRQDLVTNRAIMEVSRDLYIDLKTGQPKRGARGSNPGSLRRLAAILYQFDLTWDLYSMESQSIMEMLPSEFDRFIN